MLKSENATLITQLSKGDERDFARIFELFKKDVKTYAFFLLGNQDDAEDVTQELFIRIWMKRGSLEIRGDLKAYLNSATRNLCINTLIKNKNNALKKQMYEKNADLELTEQPFFEEDSEIMLEIKQALKTVPPKSRKAVEMIYFGQLMYKEAAVLAGVSEATLKTHVQNALKSMRPKLGVKKGKGPSDFFLILFIYFLLQSCL